MNKLIVLMNRPPCLSPISSGHEGLPLRRSTDLLVQLILNCPEVHILRKFRHRRRRLVVAMAAKEEEVAAMGRRAGKIGIEKKVATIRKINEREGKRGNQTTMMVVVAAAPPRPRHHRHLRRTMGKRKRRRKRNERNLKRLGRMFLLYQARYIFT